MIACDIITRWITINFRMVQCARIQYDWNNEASVKTLIPETDNNENVTLVWCGVITQSFSFV